MTQRGWYETELLDWWRVSRTALAGLEYVPTRFDRLQWALAQFLKAHPDQPRKDVYLDLDRVTR
jgi:hypothetical protein